MGGRESPHLIVRARAVALTTQHPQHHPKKERKKKTAPELRRRTQSLERALHTQPEQHAAV